MTHEEARVFVKEHIKYNGGKETVVTDRLVRYWWRVLNIAVFYSRLNKPLGIEIKGTRGYFAEAQPRGDKKVDLRIQDKFLSKHLFLTILVHEMVHTWEAQHHTVMGHGKRFFAWKNRIKWTVGLDLDERHDENDYRYE